MKFKYGTGSTIYTNNVCYEEFDNDSWYYDYENEMQYYKGYLLHREDGPAEECYNGSKFWHKNGKYHREDGPAVEWADGSKAWFLDGIKYSEYEYQSLMNIKKKSWILNDI